MRKMFNRKRAKSEAMELDITSLLDILVILLVFLLKSYNASNLKLDLVKGLTVPQSEVRVLGNHSVIVQIDKEKNIWLHRKNIGKINETDKEIAVLKSALEAEQQAYEKQNQKKAKAINLVFDKDLDYKQLKKVMHTSAMAGYTEFKFIVQGNY
jgi:biopolymer transport protein ExbD